MRVSAFGGGELALPASADRVRGAELVLMPSSIDVALQAANDLLVYPFGCLEQLVATTVPNLARCIACSKPRRRWASSTRNHKV